MTLDDDYQVLDDDLFYEDEGSSVSVSPYSSSDGDLVFCFNEGKSGKARRVRCAKLEFIPAQNCNQIHMIESTQRVENWIRPAFFSELASDRFKNLGQKMINEVGEALMKRMSPTELDEGVSGGFLMKKISGGFVGIFKPEEALTPRSASICVANLQEASKFNFRRGVQFSDSSVREVAAFLLDHNSFASVPETIMVKINWSAFSQRQQNDIQNFSPRRMNHPTPTRSLSLKSDEGPGFDKLMHTNSFDTRNLWNQSSPWKVGSLQKFVDHDTDACDISSSKLKVEQVHSLGVFDIRLLNTDRHEGNILVKLERENDFTSDVDIIPIDHGLILPDFEEINVKGNFCWLNWKQSSEPFQPEIQQYISQLDAKSDCLKLIQLLGSRISQRALISLKIGTLLLKIAVLEFNLTLREIGEIVVGDLDFQLSNDNSSPLISIIYSAQTEANFFDPVDREDDFFAVFSRELRCYILKLKSN